MSGATDMGRNYERERELIEAQSLDAAVRMFINRWTPDTDEMAHPRDFECDFIQIVRHIYREAQAPFVKAGAEAMARQPMPPFIMKGTP
jgi:hypothetical protein